MTPFQVLVALKPVPVVAMRLAVAVAPVAPLAQAVRGEEAAVGGVGREVDLQGDEGLAVVYEVVVGADEAGLAVVSTKVPSVQPEAVRAVKAVLAAGPILTEMTASWVSPPEEV